MKQLFFSAAVVISLSLNLIFANNAFCDDHKTLPIGSAAPDFKLPGIDGKIYSLASFKNAKLLVIVFTCDHCPTAQAYEERLIKLTRNYRSRGASVVAIM